MDISEVVNMIPRDAADEALLAIQTISTNPFNNTARVRCYLANEFRLAIKVRGDLVTISAEGRPDVSVPSASFVSTLRREIHEIDEQISSGAYAQRKPKLNFISIPPAPSHMDLPTWDEESQRWYDAEI